VVIERIIPHEDFSVVNIGLFALFQFLSGLRGVAGTPGTTTPQHRNKSACLVRGGPPDAVTVLGGSNTAAAHQP